MLKHINDQCSSAKVITPNHLDYTRHTFKYQWWIRCHAALNACKYSSKSHSGCVRERARANDRTRNAQQQQQQQHRSIACYLSTYKRILWALLCSTCELDIYLMEDNTINFHGEKILLAIVTSFRNKNHTSTISLHAHHSHNRRLFCYLFVISPHSSFYVSTSSSSSHHWASPFYSPCWPSSFSFPYWPSTFHFFRFIFYGHLHHSRLLFQLLLSFTIRFIALNADQ